MEGNGGEILRFAQNDRRGWRRQRYAAGRGLRGEIFFCAFLADHSCRFLCTAFSSAAMPKYIRAANAHSTAVEAITRSSLNTCPP